MEHSRGLSSRSRAPADPAPALGRGLALLRLLEREGASALEQLVRATGWPKSSTARLLASLERAGVVVRDARTRRYRACCRLAPIDGAETTLRDLAGPVMVRLSADIRQTVELFTFNPARPAAPLTMIDRSAPEDVEVHVRARIGFVRHSDEIDALTQVAMAFGGIRRPLDAPPAWVWKNGRKTRVSVQIVRTLVCQARQTGVGVDVGVNEFGIVRYAAPLRERSGRLHAVLAIAAYVSPRQPHPYSPWMQRLRDAAEIIEGKLQQTNS